MKLQIHILGSDHYHEIPEWDFKRRPFPLPVFLELTEGSEVYDERYLQLEVTGKRIELRDK